MTNKIDGGVFRLLNALNADSSSNRTSQAKSKQDKVDNLTSTNELDAITLDEDLQTSSSDPQKVQELKRKVNEGSYAPSSKDVAAKLAEELLV